MRTYPFVTVDVFTDRRFGGNPLAVFPDASGLSDAEMQALAAEFNLSETTFVLPPADPARTARVRIFNRSYEMPFAGHPNVGTGAVLAWAGRDRDGVLLFEEAAGLVEVRVERDDAGAVTGATIAAPRPLLLGPDLGVADLGVAEVAACAGLAPSDVLTAAHRPVLASVGVPFVIAEVDSAALARAAPDVGAFRRVRDAWPAPGGRLALHLYAHDGDVQDGDVQDGQRLRARMFSPLSGTIEDAATGSAATPLAALLCRLGEGERFEITQGVEMGRPSTLHATAAPGADGMRASVGGGCVRVLEGVATL